MPRSILASATDGSTPETDTTLASKPNSAAGANCRNRRAYSTNGPPRFLLGVFWFFRITLKSPCARVRLLASVTFFSYKFMIGLHATVLQ